MSNIFIGLKKTCLGVLERGDRDKDNEISLKEGGGIEMSTTVLHSRCSLLRFVFYLPIKFTPKPPTLVVNKNINIFLLLLKLSTKC